MKELLGMLFHIRSLLVFAIWFDAPIMGLTQNYFVKPNGLGPSGTSWSEAFGDLQQAIDSADAGDEIWVAAGEYFPSNIFDTDSNGIYEPREKTFYLNKNIALYGGFAGGEVSLSERNFEINEVLLNGDIGALEDTTDDAYHVVFIDGTSPNGSITSACIIDGFEIEYGNSSDSLFPHQVGSAIFIRGNKSGFEASPLVRNCVIAENYGSFGGTVYNDGRYGLCAPIFSNCIFEDNYTYSGGAVINNGSSGDCSSTFINCKFKDNYTSYAGGAIWNFNINGICSLEVINCIFEQNESEFGGAIYNFSHKGFSWSRIVGSEFYLNKAHAYGGAIFNYDFQGDHNSEIINCTFYKNIGWHEGGAIRNWNTNTTATNSIFWENGDEIDNNEGAVTIINYCFFDDHTPGNGSITYPSGVTGHNNFDLDPLFLASSAPNLRIQQISPVINQGTPDTTGLLLPAQDMDGFDRLWGSIDIGAYENPLVNCPSSMTISQLYSPLQGTYQAQNSITVEKGAFMMPGNSAMLSAPTIIMNPTTVIFEGSELLTSQTGCSQN